MERYKSPSPEDVFPEGSIKNGTGVRYMARIMVVDDNPDVRMVTSMTLEADGHEVIESDNGLDCLAKLETGKKPDIILLDVMMPDLDGWAVANKIKVNEELKNISICMLTCKNTYDDALTSIDSAKADWHLNKPVSIKTLIKTVDWLLNQNQQLT
jgi:two-component system OmpR family response regulator